MFPKDKILQVSKNDFQEAEVKFGINLLDFCMNSTVDTGHICSTHMELTTTEVYKKWSGCFKIPVSTAAVFPEIGE